MAVASVGTAIEEAQSMDHEYPLNFIYLLADSVSDLL